MPSHPISAKLPPVLAVAARDERCHGLIGRPGLFLGVGGLGGLAPPALEHTLRCQASTRRHRWCCCCWPFLCKRTPHFDDNVNNVAVVLAHGDTRIDDNAVTCPGCDIVCASKTTKSSASKNETKTPVEGHRRSESPEGICKAYEAPTQPTIVSRPDTQNSSGHPSISPPSP